eukprot:10560921-Alexandrium_andersonii.AAC.1
MSASLVGSEMCIRDRAWAEIGRNGKPNAKNFKQTALAQGLPEALLERNRHKSKPQGRGPQRHC